MDFLKFYNIMHKTRPSGGLWYHVISNRSDVIKHGLPIVCGLYFTIQTIRHHEKFIRTTIKTCLDYSLFD